MGISLILGFEDPIDILMLTLITTAGRQSFRQVCRYTRWYIGKKKLLKNFIQLHVPMSKQRVGMALVLLSNEMEGGGTYVMFGLPYLYTFSFGRV